MGLFDRLFTKTHTTVLHIGSKSGFHLRPAASFATLAKTFDATITAETRGESVNAKQLNALLSLNLEEGDHFELSCRGKDADKALESLVSHFEMLMQKEVKNVTPPQPQHQSEYHYRAFALKGEPIGEGIAIAPIYKLETSMKSSSGKPFVEALSITKNELYSYKEEGEHSDIFLAQAALLETLPATVDSLQKFEIWIGQESDKLGEGVLASKKSDYLDLLQRVQKHMGIKRRLHLPSHPFILAADDLLPSDIETLLSSSCKGVLLRNTSPSSHAAILLRAANLPSMIVEADLVRTDKESILDSTAAMVILHPTKEDLLLAKEQASILQKEQQQLEYKRFEKSLTKNGRKIAVLANVSGIEEAKTAKEKGAEGIGLLRTEFLFTQERPSLDVQQQVYREIFDLFEEITVRTLDVGGDKSLPYLNLPQENNPFLGIRGVRLFQTHPELLEEQLLAIFLAAKEKTLKIMFPMVSTVEEFRAAKDFAAEVAKKNALDISHHHFGIMIEVPSTLFLIEAFNKEVDFYSIGSNDLLQYLFATERTHPTLKIPEDSTVIFDVIEEIIKSSNKPVSICGELAAQPKHIFKLLRTGIQTLSLSASNIPTIKESIRHV